MAGGFAKSLVIVLAEKRKERLTALLLFSALYWFFIWLTIFSLQVYCFGEVFRSEGSIVKPLVRVKELTTSSTKFLSFRFSPVKQRRGFKRDFGETKGEGLQYIVY